MWITSAASGVLDGPGSLLSVPEGALVGWAAGSEVRPDSGAGVTKREAYSSEAMYPISSSGVPVTAGEVPEDELGKQAMKV